MITYAFDSNIVSYMLKGDNDILKNIETNVKKETILKFRR